MVPAKEGNVTENNTLFQTPLLDAKARQTFYLPSDVTAAMISVSRTPPAVRQRYNDIDGTISQLKVWACGVNAQRASIPLRQTPFLLTSGALIAG
ncbi:hypothetical protein E2C01_092814 [Portunus trituberculatus]|uniref:Uncharacterized protein n=1 Tax=Portunus trituberculatus TaxID=210409 RepID=A0A5B7JT78_PORTR|nr:hypothetical protein [Portunus trituberculatus]